MEKPGKTNTAIIVSSMLKIFNHLKSKGDLDTSGHGTDFLHWKDFPMDDDQKKIRHLMDNVIRLFVQKNPQVSEFSIYQSLLFDLTQNAIWSPDDFPDVESEYQKITNELLKYEAISNVDIPIVNLQVDEKPIKFGLVTFFKIQESDKSGKWWDSIKNTSGEYANKVYSFARISCPGDWLKSVDYASEVISETLNILRAVGFSYPDDPNLHFWLINEYPLFQTRPYRSKLISESFRLNHRPEIVHRLGPGLAICRLQNDILDTVHPSTLYRLQSLIESDFSNPKSELKTKFFFGLHWLGEATKPDTINSRFVKLSLSLEGLIGGETGNSRELKTILAKRCAIIAEKELEKQKKLFSAILRHYKKRSEIVHGANKKVTEREFSNFGDDVRKVAWSLIEKIDDFADINELHNWAQTHPSWGLL